MLLTLLIVLSHLVDGLNLSLITLENLRLHSEAVLSFLCIYLVADYFEKAPN